MENQLKTIIALLQRICDELEATTNTPYGNNVAKFGEIKNNYGFIGIGCNSKIWLESLQRASEGSGV